MNRNPDSRHRFKVRLRQVTPVQGSPEAGHSFSRDSIRYLRDAALAAETAILQRLKPHFFAGICGTVETVPFLRQTKQIARLDSFDRPVLPLAPFQFFAQNIKEAVRAHPHQLDRVPRLAA